MGRLVLGLLYGWEAVRGKLVCHKCGNRRCVNPAHLYLGTPQDNSDDKWKDGTMPVGEKNPRYRKDVPDSEVFYLYDSLGLSQQEIAV